MKNRGRFWSSRVMNPTWLRLSSIFHLLFCYHHSVRYFAPCYWLNSLKSCLTSFNRVCLSVCLSLSSCVFLYLLVLCAWSTDPFTITAKKIKPKALPICKPLCSFRTKKNAVTSLLSHLKKTYDASYNRSMALWRLYTYFNLTTTLLGFPVKSQTSPAL